MYACMRTACFTKHCKIPAAMVRDTRCCCYWCSQALSSFLCFLRVYNSDTILCTVQRPMDEVFFICWNRVYLKLFLVNCNKKTKVLIPRHLYCSITLFKPFVCSCLDGRVVNNIFSFKIIKNSVSVLILNIYISNPSKVRWPSITQTYLKWCTQLNSVHIYFCQNIA